MQHIRDNIEAWHKIKLLKDHGAAALPCARIRTAIGKHIGAINQNFAIRGIGQAVHHPKKGGLARPRAANDPDKGRSVDRKANAVNGNLAAKNPGYVAHFEHKAPFQNLEGRIAVQ